MVAEAKNIPWVVYCNKWGCLEESEEGFLFYYYLFVFHYRSIYIPFHSYCIPVIPNKSQSCLEPHFAIHCKFIYLHAFHTRTVYNSFLHSKFENLCGEMMVVFIRNISDRSIFIF